MSIRDGCLHLLAGRAGCIPGIDASSKRRFNHLSNDALIVFEPFLIGFAVTPDELRALSDFETKFIRNLGAAAHEYKPVFDVELLLLITVATASEPSQAGSEPEQ